MLPTISCVSSGARNRSPIGRTGTGAGKAGGGNGPLAAHSRSISASSASASSWWPWVSSQRGDSGRFLRRYQTISEPMPAITNIGRQP